MLKPMIQYGNPDGYEGEVVRKIYTQMSDNARKFVYDRLMEINSPNSVDPDLWFGTVELGFERKKDEDTDNTQLIQRACKMHRRICITLLDGRSYNGVVSNIMGDSFILNDLEFDFDEIEEAYF